MSRSDQPDQTLERLRLLNTTSYAPVRARWLTLTARLWAIAKQRGIFLEGDWFEWQRLPEDLFQEAMKWLETFGLSEPYDELFKVFDRPEL